MKFVSRTERNGKPAAATAPGHPLCPPQAPGQGHAVQGGQPDGRVQPGHRVRANTDVAARPPHQYQHGAQHDAAEHDCGGPHHPPRPDHVGNDTRRAALYS